jgi:hypothetical protein
MKNNYRRLNAILKLFDIDVFWSISVGTYDINLFADYSTTLIKLAYNHKFTSEIDERGWVILTRGMIKIKLS